MPDSADRARWRDLRQLTRGYRRWIAVAAALSLIGSALGSPFPPAVYIGHPGWKAVGGRIGYSLATGISVGAQCAITAAMARPEVRRQFTEQGARIVGSTPEESAAFIRDEVAKWAEVVRVSGAKSD